MKTKKILLGTLLVLILSALYHDIYELFPNTITSFFFPIDESIWEHNKMILLAFITWAILEKISMKSSKNSLFKNLVACVTTIILVLTIFTPVFSGFVIEKFSYSMLFTILSIEAIIIIIISSQIKSFYVDDKKVNLKSYFSEIKKYSHLSNIYKCMFFRRISLQGAITDLLPVLLFLKIGSELSVGGYNSMFAIISIVSLSFLKLINKKNIHKKFYILFAIFIFISSIFLIFNTSFITLLIYYILMNSLGSVLESESCSVVYDAINVDKLSQYKREHQITFNIYMLFGQVISYSFALFLYTYFYNANILSIAICIMMFFSIIAAIIL